MAYNKLLFESLETLNSSFDYDMFQETKSDLFLENGISRYLSEGNIKSFLRYIPKSNRDEKYGWEFSQIDPYYQMKATYGSGDINLDDIDIMNLDPDCTSQSKILVIYTGGTIGMRIKNDGYQPENNYFCKALRKLPMFHDSNVKSDIFTQYCNTFIMPRSHDGRRVIYVIWEYDPLLDSCDITIDDYLHIAKDIKSEYSRYDGFVILHGTDTLAYTGASLSFILENLAKPVILTGSQIPVFELRSDGRENFLNSLLLASHYAIPEVMLFFHDKLMRANRCSKLSSMQFKAFDSPNHPPLAIIGVEIAINSHLIRQPPLIGNSFQIQTQLCPDVSVLRLFPSINIQTVEALLSPPIKGMVLQSFGCGNVSVCREDILNCFKNASDNGVIIINISQCSRGGVRNIYRTGSILYQYGVISGIDMTPETALSKLSYVLGKSEWSLEEKRNFMAMDLRGEISVSLDNESTIPKIKRPNQDNLIMNRKMVMMATRLATRIGDVKMLEKVGHQINKWDFFDNNGRTLLHIAAEANQTDTVKFLLSKGRMTNVNALDRNGFNPLLVAIVTKADHDLIKLLLDKGASLVRDANLERLVLNCISDNELEILERFHLANFDFNKEIHDLNNPFHVAVIHGQCDIVKWLVEIVAIDRTAKNSFGRTALDEAECRGHQNIRDLLLEKTTKADGGDTAAL